VAEALVPCDSYAGYLKFLTLILFVYVAAAFQDDEKNKQPNKKEKERQRERNVLKLMHIQKVPPRAGVSSRVKRSLNHG